MIERGGWREESIAGAVSEGQGLWDLGITIGVIFSQNEDLQMSYVWNIYSLLTCGITTSTKYHWLIKHDWITQEKQTWLKLKFGFFQ